VRPGGPTRGRERFPETREEIGEDPARWLDRDLLESTPGDKSEKWRLQRRVDGIHSLQVAEKWAEVERELERGPRDPVMDMIRERVAYLNHHRTLEELLEETDVEARREETPSTDSVVSWPDRDGGERSENTVDPDRYRATATDGGERE
jgi:hypothetical protein